MSTAKTALVLEGGGMRGIFTAGVLDYFLEQNVEFNSCIGVSAGSCHACSYLAKQYKRAFETSVNYLNDKRYCSLYSLITTGDLFGAKFTYEKIPMELHPIDNNAFLQNSTTFQAVITNCITGRAEYPVINDLIKDVQIIRASSSLPFVSNIVIINDKPYLDGGMADSIPIKQSIKQGNSKNVIILTRQKDYRKEANKNNLLMKIKYGKYPNLINQMKNRHINYNKTLDFIYKQQALGNVFVIQPEIPIGINRIEKNAEKLKQLYTLGYETAKEKYSDMLKYLKA